MSSRNLDRQKDSLLNKLKEKMTKKKRIDKFLMVIIIVFMAMIQRSDSQNNFVPTYYQPVPHPRLLLLKGEEEAIMKASNEEVLKMKVNEAIINESNKILTKTPIERKLEGKRLLSKSREFLKRIFFLSFGFWLLVHCP